MRPRPGRLPRAAPEAATLQVSARAAAPSPHLPHSPHPPAASAEAQSRSSSPPPHKTRPLQRQESPSRPAREQRLHLRSLPVRSEHGPRPPPRLIPTPACGLPPAATPAAPPARFNPLPSPAGPGPGRPRSCAQARARGSAAMATAAAASPARPHCGGSRPPAAPPAPARPGRPRESPGVTVGWPRSAQCAPRPSLAAVAWRCRGPAPGEARPPQCELRPPGPLGSRGQSRLGRALRGNGSGGQGGQVSG